MNEGPEGKDGLRSSPTSASNGPAASRQCSLPLTWAPGRRNRGGTLWGYRGHYGYYAAGWLCTACFGFWTTWGGRGGLAVCAPCDSLTRGPSTP